MIDKLLRRQTEPTSADLREQHRQVALRISQGSSQVKAAEARAEQLRMRRAELVDVDTAHPELEKIGADIKSVEAEIADLVAQQRYRERKAQELDYLIRAAESREAPGLQAERSARHTELRRGLLPETLRSALAVVEEIQALQSAMMATHHQYGATADVLPLYSVLDRLSESLHAAVNELEQTDRQAVTMAQTIEESGTAHLLSAHWVES